MFYVYDCINFLQFQICRILYLSESIFIYFYIFCIFSIMFLVLVHSFIKCLVLLSFRSVHIFSKFKKYFSISAFVLLNQYLCLTDLKEVVLQELHCQTSEGFFTYLLLQIPFLPPTLSSCDSPAPKLPHPTYRDGSVSGIGMQPRLRIVLNFFMILLCSSIIALQRQHVVMARSTDLGIRQIWIWIWLFVILVAWPWMIY